MLNFLWNTDKEQNFTPPYTFQLVVNQSQSGALMAKSVLGCRIWIVTVSGGACYLAARIQVDSIEIFEEGPDKGDLLFSGDVDVSCHFLPEDTMARERWKVPPELLSRCMQAKRPLQLRDDEIHALNAQVDAAVERSLSPPNERLLTAATNMIKSNRPTENINSILRMLRTQFSLGDLPFFARHPSNWDNFASVAYFCLRANGLDELESKRQINDYLQERESGLVAALPNVDTLLSPISVDSIVTRSFVMQQPKTMESSIDAILKTNKAERRHQAILKDLVETLSAKGVECMQTRSVDLVVEGGNAYSLFEVKSATQQNLFVQTIKAAMQLLYYRYEFESDGRKVCRLCAIVEKPPRISIPKRLRDFVDSLNIELLTYDSSQEWPDRVIGLVD